MNANPSERQIFSVSQLNRSVRNLLETQLPMLWVEGEISNFARPGSGHWYLTLKDDKAQVRCAMFRNANQRVGFQPANGTQVLVRCRAGLYEGRGEYQLVIEHMEEAGFGALQRQFEQLKQKLTAEGLFDNQHKQPLPNSVSHVGVITSATGAAVKDILSVLQRRFPSIRISIFPTLVQGEQAAKQIVQAIADANQHSQCDALIVGRGGGSLEDLWPFNEEVVARAIFASTIPVVSAVGHEVDFTIADFVADLRAPTPSAAAELLSPDREDMLNQFEGFEILLNEALSLKIRQLEQRTDYLQKRLRHPGHRLQEQTQHLDHLEIRLRRAITGKVQAQLAYMNTVRDKLLAQNQRPAIAQHQKAVAHSTKQMMRAVAQQLSNKQTETSQAMQMLDTVSPLKTLGRGYAIIRDNSDKILSSVDQVSAGDTVKGQLTDGELILAVTATTTKSL